tara:strand:+ start:1237 stop:1977 length:741 start_codon:yes stop_codon:yes gene_type:complete
MDQQNKTDALEILIISAMFLLIVVIYVPVAIWEDESFYEKESRSRMQNMYDIQTFYSRLTGQYSSSFLEAMEVVNAVRDSTIADSLFFGEQTLLLNNEKYLISVNQSYGFEYDTTFGIKSFRKDTVLDTILQINMYSEELGRDDTSFIQKKELVNYESMPNFKSILKEEPNTRIQAFEYYRTYIPDSINYFCPLTNKPYNSEISEDGSSLTISSPIEIPIIERYYVLFTFKAENHGFIKDGRKSWD